MRYVVLRANLINNKPVTKVVDAVTYSDKGGDPAKFFFTGITSDHVKIGEVDITIVEGGDELEATLPKILPTEESIL